VPQVRQSVPGPKRWAKPNDRFRSIYRRIVIRSVVEGPVFFTWKRDLARSQICHPDRSVAEWRDLRFLFGLTQILKPFDAAISGAGDGDRTRNQRLGKPLLYH
jgi:hypothetical protein